MLFRSRIVVSEKKDDAAAPSTPSAPGLISWSSEVSPQKWMHYYTKVLAKVVNSESLRVQVSVEFSPQSGVSRQQVEEIESALREMGIVTKVNSSQS